MSCRLCCRNCRTFCWCPRISALRRLSTLWLLFLCATSLRTAEAAASSGDGTGRLRGSSGVPSSAASASLGSSSSASPSASPGSSAGRWPSASGPSPVLSWAAMACAHCRLPSTAAMAADIAAFEALAAASDALTAAPTKRSAAALVPAPGPSSCSSAAVVSVTSAQARAEFNASIPKLMAVTARSAQLVEAGFLWAAMRHWAATSRVA
mmetsp:Transcript_48051/g.137244  ORF Transcript_48051/g.137244 Transcript_48051/m.137244 type:complete len:209 (-) Transcript_48051:1720-2346(-)